ncbi:hypothetical protein MYCTH_2297142 [Thermothelomyces thermophilus ATCC 42464]|uniref:Uncharacterized protein n=1 Tax=Thermothelomyces thermophilus (strain ATCC 42464 / BCRC 31852 / DSM 1799) TaxID=573729 RepID=G2Q4L6_THET4|nr:uncharacterized protein MYCTH_2297142 [Thermothelomyces thermophilus ATCC 42464]AEO54505.1 hypothetical protein MYCTH_2297142 [Thermothelomyces thermophilus ATCC 42464]
MCHICRRLDVVLQSPPPEVIAARKAEEEARVRRFQEQLAALRAQGITPRAPRKQLPGPCPPEKVVVEPAPSHDGAPTFAAYSVPLPELQADPDSDDGYGNSPPATEPEKHRPKFGIRLYDTTADATAERAAMLARRISELTRYDRMSSESFGEDRIEVVALPLPSSTTDEERAVICISHNEAERQVRLPLPDPAVAASWYIAEDFYGSRKILWVIHDLKDSWEEALKRTTHEGGEGVHGHFLQVYYGYEDDSEDDEDEPPRDFYLGAFRLEQLGWLLGDFRGVRGNVFEFFQTHFVPDRVLDKELALPTARIWTARPKATPCVSRRPEAHGSTPIQVRRPTRRRRRLSKVSFPFPPETPFGLPTFFHSTIFTLSMTLIPTSYITSSITVSLIAGFDD